MPQRAGTPTAPRHTVTGVRLPEAFRRHTPSPHEALRLPKRRAGPNFSSLPQGQGLGSAGRTHRRRRTALRRWRAARHAAGAEVLGLIGHFLIRQQNRIPVGDPSQDREATGRSLLEGLWDATPSISL